ncbi:MAG: LysR family transcriptional regulator [Alphaproteobacteria bacterium]|nr:MAG: LysR family transcriptional regulator [Alphaproteobacteria bacterium]
MVLIRTTLHAQPQPRSAADLPRGGRGGSFSAAARRLNLTQPAVSLRRARAAF